jgi:bifunctional non-homologous end joining protein LigD
MLIYDRGTYETEKWRDDEVIVVFHGTRTHGRYVLFQTRGKDWMVHRMDPPEPSWTPMPAQVRPMRPCPAERLPRPARDWAFEMRWNGIRALGFVSGGRLRLASEGGAELTDDYPRTKPLGEALAPAEVVLDGELVTFGKDPVYLVFDVLWLDGRSTVDLPYRDRRELLDGLEIAGPLWQTPPYFAGTGREALLASREQGLAGVVAKRLDSPYRPGERSEDWLLIAT